MWLVSLHCLSHYQGNSAPITPLAREGTSPWSINLSIDISDVDVVYTVVPHSESSK